MSSSAMSSDPWLFAQPIFLFFFLYPDSNNPPIEVPGDLFSRLGCHCLLFLIHIFIQYGLVLGRPTTKVSACGSESVGIIRCLPSS